MIDIHTHKIIDILNSREQKDVVAWLKTYPNLQLISRDGSITYKNAIHEAHPSAVQVSDRFHLHKNITEYAADYLKKKLKLIIKVAIGKNVSAYCTDATFTENNSHLTLAEKYSRMIQLQNQGKNQTQICKLLNLSSRTYKKLLNATEDERNRKFVSLQEQRRQEKIKYRENMANEIRSYLEQGLSRRAIARITGMSRNTINRYLDPDFIPVHASFGKKKKGILSAYEDVINELLQQGTRGTEIEKYIREEGYVGSSSLVRHYITEWKKKYKNDSVAPQNSTENNNRNHIISIKRTTILKLLFYPTDKIKEIDQNILNLLFEQYPFVKQVLDLVISFKNILCKKNATTLKFWMDEVKRTDISELKSFVKGLERDYEAVINSIKLPYNNGLAEGKVNKLKVIKRIMYGRCGFEMLRNKVIGVERMI